jgi:hypothetical protein
MMERRANFGEHDPVEYLIDSWEDPNEVRGFRFPFTARFFSNHLPGPRLLSRPGHFLEGAIDRVTRFDERHELVAARLDPRRTFTSTFLPTKPRASGVGSRTSIIRS